MTDAQLNKTDSSRSNNSNNLHTVTDSDVVVTFNRKEQKFGLLRDIIETENDLAGFSIAWMIGFFIIVTLRIAKHEDVRDAYWWWIFLIPIAICCLTWIFSYVITKYRKAHSKESMKIPAFILPFVCKIVLASFLFARLFYASGGITDRHKDKDAYDGWCDCSMFVIWLSLNLSVITTEIIITTVMINSSLNLRAQIPKKVDVFLFVTRPILWVYNRLIVMFLTFYCYFYVFGIGPFCTNQCKVNDAHVSSIGVSILILPFRNIFYLFKWEPFDLNQHSDSKEVVYAVIQQVLIFTTILDLLMDIWSVSEIFKREVGQFRAKMRNSISQFRGSSKTSQTSQTSQKGEKLKPISENEDIEDVDDMSEELQSLDNLKVGDGDIDTEKKEEESSSNNTDKKVDDNGDDMPDYSKLQSSSLESKEATDTNLKINAKPQLSVIDSQKFHE